MPTLLQINVTANWGSTGKIAEQIGLCAMAHGWKSYIAYGRMMNPSKNRLIKIGTKLDVYEHYTESKFLDNEGLASRRATKKFLKKVDEIKPDIVHLHNIHDHYVNYRLLFKYLAEKKIPTVWTQHDQWATTGHCMYNVCGCERWKEECHDCPLSKWYSLDCSRRNYRLKKKLLAEIPSLTIVPVSDWLGNNIRQSHLKNRTIEIIHNGIDIHMFNPQPINKARKHYGIEISKILILGVSSIWNNDKGLDDFIALSRNDDFVVMLVGLSQEQVKLLKSEKYSGCNLVPISRTQNQQELAKIYSMADVFVNLTYADMFPTVNLEALACGTPVVTYRTGGSPEAVDEKTGVEVNQGDVEGVAEAVRKIKKHPLLAENCRKRVEENFDKGRCFEEYLKLYSRILVGNN